MYKDDIDFYQRSHSEQEKNESGYMEGKRVIIF